MLYGKEEVLAEKMLFYLKYTNYFILLHERNKAQSFSDERY